MKKVTLLTAIAVAVISTAPAFAQDIKNVVTIRQTGDDGYIYLGNNASKNGSADIRQAGYDDHVKAVSSGGGRILIDQTADSFLSYASALQYGNSQNAQISLRQTGHSRGLVDQNDAAASLVSLRQDGQSSAAIVQIGAGNSFVGRQNNNYEEGVSNTAFHADVDQVGSNNAVSFAQNTERGSLTIAQGKRDNFMPALQVTGNVATVTQSGTDGSIVMGQTGNYNTATALQSGISNVLKLQQSGNGATASLTQNGTSLLLDLKQTAAADATLTQSGDDNQLVITQEAAGARMTIVQSGTNNQTMVNQVRY